MLLSLWIMFHEERRKDVLHVMERKLATAFMKALPGSAWLHASLLPGYCHCCIACSTASAFTISYPKCISFPLLALTSRLCIPLLSFTFYPFIPFNVSAVCNRKTEPSRSFNRIRPFFKVTGKCTMCASVQPCWKVYYELLR